MSEYVHTSVSNGTGFITLDRPKALNSLSLAMVRDITRALLAWRDDTSVDAVVIRSSSAKAFCAGGDIRFFYDVGRATPQGGSALLEDFFTEEYALNHLIHHYPKPYIALMDGVVMGGGMGVAQGGPDCRIRVVTERTKMAMPEVNIGLFPDVGGSYFLSRAPGQLGNYLGLTGLTIGAADALYVGLADHFVPEAQMAALVALIEATLGAGLREAIAAFAAPFQADVGGGDHAIAGAGPGRLRAAGLPGHGHALAADDGGHPRTAQARRGPRRGRLPAHGTHTGAPQLRTWRSDRGRARAGDRQGQRAALVANVHRRSERRDGGALLRAGMAGARASAAPSGLSSGLNNQDCSRCRSTTRSFGWKYCASLSAMYTERCWPPVQPSATVR